MQIPPPPPPLVPIWHRRIVALAVLVLLAGCANGDFKQVRPLLVRDDIHDWVGSAAIAGTNTTRSGFPLTDDERGLRDLAYPLIQPAYERQQWYSVAGEYGLIASDRRQSFNRTAYANHLFGARYRSPAARYSQLTDDVHNDTTRLPQFFETATRVLDIDQKRRKSMAYVSALSLHEKNEVQRRMYANASIISLVRSKLNQRVASYRFAPERLVLMSPMEQAVGAEQALNQLQAKIAYYNSHAAPTWAREQSLASSR
jgi:hypothetical protein